MTNQNLTNKCVEALVKALSDATGFDPQTSEIVITTYVEQTKNIIEEINTTLKQLEEDQTNEELLLHISRQAHKLKGSSGNVRDFKMMALAEHIETASKALKIEEIYPSINEIDVYFSCYLDN